MVRGRVAWLYIDLGEVHLPRGPCPKHRDASEGEMTRYSIWKAGANGMGLPGRRGAHPTGWRRQDAGAYLASSASCWKNFVALNSSPALHASYARRARRCVSASLSPGRPVAFRLHLVQGALVQAGAVHLALGRRSTGDQADRCQANESSSDHTILLVRRLAGGSSHPAQRELANRAPACSTLHRRGGEQYWGKPRSGSCEYPRLKIPNRPELPGKPRRTRPCCSAPSSAEP